MKPQLACGRGTDAFQAVAIKITAVLRGRFLIELIFYLLKKKSFTMPGNTLGKVNEAIIICLFNLLGG